MTTRSFANDFELIKKVFQEDLIDGLSITWSGKDHLWPAKYRPANESFDDTMKHMLTALYQNPSVTKSDHDRLISDLSD